MTDRDVVQRVADLFGANVMAPRVLPAPRKAMHRTVVVGRKAAAIMRLLMPLFGERRRAKAVECLKDWAPGKYRGVEGC